MIDNLQTIQSKPLAGTILNFGPPMTGKTTSLSTLLKMGLKPVWIFDWDWNVQPLVRRALQSKEIQPDDVQIFHYGPRGGDRMGPTERRPKGQGYDMYQDFLKDFNSLFDKIDIQTGQFRPDTNAPKVIVTDSWTTFQEVLLDAVLHMMGQELGGPGTDGRNQYGKQMGKIVEFIRCCQSLPCISIFNAHEKMDKNEVTGEIRIDPLVTGQLSPSISKEFSIVLYSDTKKDGQETRYIWRTKPSGFVKSTGTRFSDNLPAEIEQDYRLVLPQMIQKEV